MGKLYGMGAPINQSFEFQGTAPLDNRVAVQTIDDRDALNAYKGLITYVEAEKKYYAYTLNETGSYEWQELKVGSSSDDEGGSSGEGLSDSALLILLDLLAEVAKLRNSFLYGINSYLGTDTAAGRVVNGYLYVDDKEPLWAIEEDDLALSYLSDLDFDTSHPNLTVQSGTLDVSNLGIVGIEDAYWEDPLNILSGEDSAKHLVYMSASSDDITLELLNADKTSTYNVSLKGLAGSVSTTSYHYLIILSRLKDGRGARFVYISIDNNINGLNLAKGYYNNGSLSTDRVTVPEDYHINRIYFKNLNLTKLNFYTKYQDFSNEVISEAPKEQDYKYSAAHITVREVESDTVLESIKDHLLAPELVWIKETSTLKINTSSGIYTVGSSTNNDEYTEMEIKTALQTLGITTNTDGDLELNPVASVTLVNSEGDKYTTTVDTEGNIVTTKLDTSNTMTALAELAASLTYPNNAGGTALSFTSAYTRGFIAKILYALAYDEETSSWKLSPDTTVNTKDWGLHSDRLKIGAFYMNCTDTTADIIYSCSHAYIELENTSDADLPLTGCTIAFTKPVKTNGAITLQVITLPLTGVIKKNSTYLIRGKKYIEYDDALIKVKTYDLEWTDLDTTVETTLKDNGTVGFLLYYNANNVDIKTTAFVTANTSSNLTEIGISNSDDNLKSFPNRYDYRYIDSTGISIGDYKWFINTGFTTVIADAIYKNTFELDPAKLAFLSLNVKDSSRARNASGTDCMVIPLSTENITFNKTFMSYPKTRFTPKASFENKNVCTDKTPFDIEKPNMVTCSFGINIHTTRCFNWISEGNHHEFVFIKNSDGTWERFESYGGTNKDSGSSWTKKSITTTELTIYNRMTGIFPATNITYTAHKCILNHNQVTTPITFTYVVGRADNDGNPDPNHSSEEYTFTLYPDFYTPRVYQVTDLQGFHWVEYQVWSIAAIELNKKILSDCASENIIPVLINTGDMTLNGTRINEWLDYYNAGLPLFKHLEQMNVVGNNDLCNKDESILGTGDDNGKINPYYFHLFYCYEQPDPEKFIVNGIYIPSTYYFGNDAYKYLMVNSEITINTCYQVYGLGESNDSSINIYTGYTVYTASGTQTYSTSGFTPIYNTLYSWLNTYKNVKWLPCCHEMPFTVITGDNLKSGDTTVNSSRSINAANSSLVGSHLNLLTKFDIKGSYWFSRLLEFFGIPLCIGGHKHTYVCTFPLRENFTWTGGSSATSLYTMPETLETDDVTWSYTDSSISMTFNSTKIPYTNVASAVPEIGNSKIYPIRYVGDDNISLNTVTYLMCQASGYKVKSNKELPSASLLFSKVVAGTDGSSALVSQLYPMYCIIKIEDSKFKASMVRLANIFTISSKNSEAFNIQKDKAAALQILEFDASSITETACMDNTTEDYQGLKTSSLWKNATSNEYYIYTE